MIPDEESSTIAVIFFVGMAAPIVVALPMHDVLALYLTGSQFLVLAAATFALLAWVSLEAWEVDRTNFLVASLLFPWIGIIVGTLLLGLTLGVLGVVFEGFALGEPFDGFFGYLLSEVWDFIAYAAFYTIAGVAAVTLQRRVDRLARQNGWRLTPLTIAVGLVVLLTLVAAVGGGYATVAASPASISDVEADVLPSSTGGDDIDHRFAQTGLVVEVEGEPTELRLTVTAPDGTTTIERLTAEDLQGGTATVELGYWRFDAPLQAGTYEVELSALTGVTVDRTTYTIETEPTPALRQIEVVPANDESTVDVPADATVRDPTGTDAVRIVTVIANEGDAPGRFTTRLMTGDGEYVTVQDIVIEPGQSGVNVVGVSDEDVEAIRRRSDGELAVEILFDGDVVTTETVTLPETGGE